MSEDRQAKSTLVLHATCIIQATRLGGSIYELRLFDQNGEEINPEHPHRPHAHLITKDLLLGTFIQAMELVLGCVLVGNHSEGVFRWTRS